MYDEELDACNRCGEAVSQIELRHVIVEERSLSVRCDDCIDGWDVRFSDIDERSVTEYSCLCFECVVRERGTSELVEHEIRCWRDVPLPTRTRSSSATWDQKWEQRQHYLACREEQAYIRDEDLLFPEVEASD